MAKGGTKPRHHGGGKGGKHAPKHGRKALGVRPGASPIPPFAADPSIEAERRAAFRGLQDTAQDLRISSHQAKRDTRTTVRDTRVQKHRGMQDLASQLRRGRQDIGFEKHGQKIEFGRTKEDFSTKLQNLVRQFTVQGQEQTQAANVQGVLDEGTSAASAAARSKNFAVARQPLDIARRRAGEDYKRNLFEYQREGARLTQDVRRGRGRLSQDTHHDIRLARQDLHRTLRSNTLQRQRSIREQAIGNADLIQQEIWAARQSNPQGNFPAPPSLQRRLNRR